MEKKIKTVNRTIANSRNCRVKFGLPIDFNTLEVNIRYNNRIFRYEVAAEYLPKTTDSIRFYPEISNGNLTIRWNNEIAPYIKLIH